MATRSKRWYLKWEQVKRSSKLEKAHCLSGAARYIADGMSTREFEREGEEIKPKLRTQK